MKKTILFPTDFAKPSFTALQYAISFASILNAEIQIMHCKSSNDEDTHIESMKEQFVNELQKTQTNYQFQFTFSKDPSTQIIQACTTNNPTLLIMSTHGRHPLAKWMLGSITEQVMRHTPTPVILVPCNTKQQVPNLIKVILVGIDFSLPSRQALNWAKYISKQCDGEIHILHTIESGVFQGTPFEFPSLQNLVPNAEQTILEAFKNFDSNIPIPTLSHHHVLTGIASKEMVALAEQLNAQLLVIGPHGSGGMRELLLGSTTERVVRMSPCPVFIAKNSPEF
ncbi:MAG: universal stress protein [bacterium]|nr:universal stress protein [bacterium]